MFISLYTTSCLLGCLDAPAVSALPPQALPKLWCNSSRTMYSSTNDIWGTGLSELISMSVADPTTFCVTVDFIPGMFPSNERALDVLSHGQTFYCFHNLFHCRWQRWFVSTCLSAHSPVDWVKVLVKACSLSTTKPVNTVTLYGRRRAWIDFR